MFLYPRPLLTGNLSGGNLHSVDKWGENHTARPQRALAQAIMRPLISTFERQPYFISSHQFCNSYRVRARQKCKLGCYVITPFELNDGRTVLVNRGYVGVDYMDAAKRAAGQIDYEHSITGILRLSDENP